jgi:hypothetical protein
MASTQDTPTSTPSTTGRPGPRLGRTVALVALGALVAGWIYVLFVYDPGLMIDELEDRTFPVAAERVCAAAKADLAELPPASQAASAAERADAVERSNARLVAMVDELAAIAPTDDTRPSAGIREWIGDWRTYIGNRADYVANLRVDDEARFLEDAKGAPNKGITRAIDGFAQVNRMTSCETPDDLA